MFGAGPTLPRPDRQRSPPAISPTLRMADCPPVGAPGRCLEIAPRSRPARRQPCCGGRGRPLATGDRNPRPPAWRPPAVWRHRGKRRRPGCSAGAASADGSRFGASGHAPTRQLGRNREMTAVLEYEQRNAYASLRELNRAVRTRAAAAELVDVLPDTPDVASSARRCTHRGRVCRTRPRGDSEDSTLTWYSQALSAIGRKVCVSLEV